MSESQGEKTEKATPHKRREARKKGQVLKSAEVNTAVLTMMMFLSIYLFGGFMVSNMQAYLIRVFTVFIRPGPMSAETAHLVIIESFGRILYILLPVLIVAVVAGLIVNLAQVGFMFSPESIQPKLSKINPLSGFKRIFSLRSVVEMLKAVLKIAVMAWVVVGEYQARFDEFTGMIHLTVPAAASRIIAMVFSMAFKAVLALFAIAMADYLYQWWEYERNLRMTKEEVKQEYKREEGDPQIRQRRRQRQREMSAMRMMQALPKADVVITNPTHYAIALMYDESESPAPIVIAKGKDFLAQKIKEKAKELKIEMVENRPVAQALYVSCEVGDSIPQDLFAAVAEILASVYRMRQPNRPSQGA